MRWFYGLCDIKSGEKAKTFKKLWWWYHDVLLFLIFSLAKKWHVKKQKCNNEARFLFSKVARNLSNLCWLYESFPARQIDMKNLLKSNQSLSVIASFFALKIVYRLFKIHQL